LARQVFTNEDGSTAVLYLVTSDMTLKYEDMTTLYQKRWKVEEYHKSLKQNASLCKSPTRTVVTQTNHFFSALYAFVKLETISIKISLNHFTLKSKIYVSALKIAFEEFQKLKITYITA
ncbi:MAG: IS701 family transposase, partial [Desulfamplus sp.]